MKLQHYLLILLALGLGFLLGRKTVPSVDTSIAGHHAESGSRLGAARPDTSVSHGEGSTPVRRTRPALPPKAEEKETIEVPIDVVDAVLKGNHFLFIDLRNANERFDTALALLGATSEQRRQSAELLDDTRKQLFEAEKRQYRVRSIDAQKVELDLGNIDEEAEKVIEVTKQRFREILPEKSADMLLRSVNWTRYYPQLDPLSNYATLSIVRGGSGLMATFRNESSSYGIGINRSRFPNDGSPIPAAEVFEDRWKPFLKDVMLEPVEPTR